MENTTKKKESKEQNIIARKETYTVKPKSIWDKAQNIGNLKLQRL